MTAKELLHSQTEDVGYQLEKVLEGISETNLDFKISPSAMSVRQQVEHLCEVYTAASEICRGEEHKWGEYSVDDKSWTNLKPLYLTLREQALKLLTESDDDQSLKRTSEFIIGHDYYHVGQLAALRIACDPEWNPYSIYRH